MAKNYDIECIVKAVVTSIQELEAEEKNELENYVPVEAVKAYRMLDDYPDILEAKHVRAILSISETKTYEILNNGKCPAFKVGNRIKVCKDVFIDYLKSSNGQDILGGANA